MKEVVAAPREAAEGSTDGAAPESSSTLVSRGPAGRRGSHAAERAYRQTLALLFPSAPRSRFSRPLIALAYAVSFLVLSAVALLRQSGVPATSTVWAEDGRIFYHDAVTHSFWRTLAEPYSHYMQLLPRLEMEITRLFPISDLPRVAAITGAATFAAVGLVVFHASRGHLSGMVWRCLLVLSMTMLPIATGELLDNLVNVPWWLFFAMFWLLLWRPRSVGGKLVVAGVCFLAVASEPLIAIFLPLVVFRLLVLRTPKEQAGIVGFGAGLVYQAAIVLHSAGQSSFVRASDHGVLRALLLRVGLGWLGGNKPAGDLIALNSHIALMLGAGSLIVLVLGALLVRDRRVRLFVAATAALAVLSFVIPVWLRGVGEIIPTNSRYSATPILLLVSILLVACSGANDARSGWRSRRQVAAVTLCCFLLVPTWVIDFRDSNGRSGGPLWGTEVTNALRQCTKGSAPKAELAISPPGWQMSLPCHVVAPRSSSGRG